MSCWNKEQLENMLEDVINELDLSDIAIEKHGQLGTTPAELVRLVLEEKDKKIRALKQGIKTISYEPKGKMNCPHCELIQKTFPRNMTKREYWIMTEIFVHLHNRDYCNGKLQGNRNK